MGNKQTFDATNVQSISAFADKLCTLSQKENEIDKEFLKNHLNKAVKTLELIKEDEYKNNKTNQLLRLIQNLVFLKTKEIVNEAISSGLLRIYEKLIKYALQDQCLDTLLLFRVYSALSTLNNEMIFVKASIDNNILDLTLKILEIFIKDENIKNIEADLTFSMFHAVISYLSKIPQTEEGKQKLNKSGVISFISDLFKILNSKLPKRNKFYYVKLDIIAILVSLQSESEVEKLQILGDIVDISKTVLGHITNKYKKNNKKFLNSKFYSTYTIDDRTSYNRAVVILRQMIQISTKEEIKQKLFDSNTLEYLFKLIAKGNDEEIELTCELICSMCLNKNLISHLKSNKKVLENIIKTLRTTKNNATKRYCQQIRHLMDPTLRKMIGKSEVNHIMISYNHKYKEICSQINQELSKDGYLTWMDTKEASTDLFDAMENAIENATIVLIFYSEEYKESTICRFEADYAAELKKPMIFVNMQQNYEPDGWLGLLLGLNQYIDFSEGKIDATCMNDLRKRIDSILFDLNKSNNNKSNNNVESWMRYDTRAWFVQHDLQNISKLFPQCTGKTLKALWELKQNDYQEFNKSIGKEIKLSKINVSLQERMDFYESLQMLFN